MWLYLKHVVVRNMAADQITMPALGRPFSLGMLYDARKDELHTGKVQLLVHSWSKCFINNQHHITF